MTGVDAQGYLLQMPDTALPPAYAGLLADACARLHANLPGLIHSVYVYGSVARGTARPGKSDLDLTLVVRQAPNADQRRVLQSIQQAVVDAPPHRNEGGF